MGSKAAAETRFGESPTGRKLLGRLPSSWKKPSRGRRHVVVLTERPEDVGPGDDDAAQALAGERGTGEAGGVRRDAEEDLSEGVVREGLRRRRRMAAHGGTHDCSGCCWAWEGKSGS